MDAESTYATALGTLFTLILGWHLAAETWAWRHRASARFRKWVTNNPVGARQNGSSGISVGTVLGVLTVVSVNIFVSCFRVGTVAKLGRRLGIVAVANLTPLFLGGRSSLWANVLGGIPLPLYHTCHRWLGRVCLVQSLVHGFIQLYLSAWKFTIGDIVVCGALSPSTVTPAKHLILLLEHIAAGLNRVGLHPLLSTSILRGLPQAASLARPRPERDVVGSYQPREEFADHLSGARVVPMDLKHSVLAHEDILPKLVWVQPENRALRPTVVGQFVRPRRRSPQSQAAPTMEGPARTIRLRHDPFNSTCVVRKNPVAPIPCGMVGWWLLSGQ